MQEKLIIKNFGPIKDVELELGRFNILIGEQATGKSTVAKVLAVCRYFSYLVDYTGGESFSKGLDAWGMSDFVEYNRTLISYTCEDYFFEIRPEIETTFYHDYEDDSVDEREFPIYRTQLKPLSESFSKLLKSLEEISPNITEGYGYYDFNWQPPISFFKNEVAVVLDNPFYLPLERGLQSIFSLGKSSIQNIDDSLFNQFAKLDQIARSFKNEISIEPLGIIYKNENGQGFVKSDKHDFVRLNNAASGYQSTIPVVLTLKNYNRTKKKGKTFIIEEPELNLFPNAQQKLMEYLVEQVNDYSNSFLINTHSPYTLTSLNNMMYAWQVGQEKREEVVKVIAERYWINPADVRAYKLEEGGCRSIIDTELNQIDVGEIDKVSRSINKTWDDIANIEFAPNENQLAPLSV